MQNTAKGIVFAHPQLSKLHSGDGLTLKSNHEQYGSIESVALANTQGKGI